MTAPTTRYHAAKDAAVCCCNICGRDGQRGGVAHHVHGVAVACVGEDEAGSQILKLSVLSGVLDINRIVVQGDSEGDDAPRTQANQARRNV